MKRLKVMTVIGTRPEIIRLSRVMAKLDLYCEHIIVHTGQNYDFELNEVFFNDLQIRKPDHFLNAAGQSAAETIGNIISRIDVVLEKEKPEALLILGDTNSCLAAISAKRRKIPIFHMEAGNRCFDQRVPEEINRKIVDHVSDINLPYSDIAREYLLREGLMPDRVIKTGSPMFEVLAHFNGSISSSKILHTLGLTAKEYFIVSVHREENVDDLRNLRKILDTLENIYSLYRFPIIVSTHPRTRKKLEQSKYSIPQGVRLSSPFGFFDYNSLQMNSLAVLSDSGTISEEANILGFNALNFRESHERPEAMESSPVMMTGLEPSHVMNCLNMLLKSTIELSRPSPVADYRVGDVSEKVVKIILSYTGYVNRVVWGH